MIYENDILIRKYRGASIFQDGESSAYYWEEATGVVGGDDFDSVEDCISDIDAQHDHAEKILLAPHYMGE